MSDDRSNKEKERKNELIINLINKARILSISFFDEDIPIIKQFLQIARREAGPRGFSRTAINAFSEYNKHHSVGNPQLLITHYAKPESPQPLRVLCTYCQGALTDGRVFCEKKGMWIPGVSCYSCKNNRLRKQK